MKTLADEQKIDRCWGVIEDLGFWDFIEWDFDFGDGPLGEALTKHVGAVLNEHFAEMFRDGPPYAAFSIEDETPSDDIEIYFRATFGDEGPSYKFSLLEMVRLEADPDYRDEPARKEIAIRLRAMADLLEQVRDEEAANPVPNLSSPSAPPDQISSD